MQGFCKSLFKLNDRELSIFLWKAKNQIVCHWFFLPGRKKVYRAVHSVYLNEIIRINFKFKLDFYEEYNWETRNRRTRKIMLVENKIIGHIESYKNETGKLSWKTNNIVIRMVYVVRRVHWNELITNFISLFTKVDIFRLKYQC